MKKSSLKPKKKLKQPALDADSILLMKLVKEKKYDVIKTNAERILNKFPKHSLALKALGFALIGLQKFEEAIPVIEFSCHLYPNDSELHNNLGIVLSSLMRWDEAIDSFKKSLKLEPNAPETLKNMGVAFARMRRWNEAVPYFLKAIEHYPGDYLDAIKLLTDALLNANRIDEAWVCCNQLYKNFPSDYGILSQFLTICLRRCEWGNISELLNQFKQRLEGAEIQISRLNPFSVLSFPGISSQELQIVSKNFAHFSIPAEFFLPVDDSLFSLTKRGRSRLKIGYLSGDFRNHAVAHVIVDAVENHNKSKVETFAYSLSKGDDSEVRNRLIKAFDHFVDLSSAGYAETARRIRKDGIHILVDLHGWTVEGRAEALAMRCAPVQATWLGYAGTLGHKRLADYLIGDSIVTPVEDAPFYEEEVVNMPHSYMPADTKILPARRPSRAEVGLPEKGFVFCSFNNSYKFNPEVFDLWCRILGEAAGSYLWLSSQSDAVKNNLEKEVQKRGVDPNRLIFASRIEARDEHLARLQLADLALDPFPYNSHSTGVDILWAGVPMVTLKGNTFAGRVGASLLLATNLSDLIATSNDEYFSIATNLFADAKKLQNYRAVLEKRQSLPLFNMADFASSLEKSYEYMWNRYLSMQ